MKSPSLLLILVGGLALAACGDDTSETTGSGGAGGGGSTGNTTATTGGLTTSSTASSSSTSGNPSSSSGGGEGGNGSGGDPGTGGNGTGGDPGTGGNGTGGGPGTGGSGTGGGGTGGGADFCSDIVVLADVDDVCELADVDTSTDGTAPCADLEDTWPARFYRIEVEAGDCLYMRADNAGSDGVDLFGAIIDPDGNDIFPDDDVDCTDGSSCPEGALTMASAGTAYVAVGAYADDACTAGTDAPFQLAISVNGVAVDLADATSCEGDLFIIIQ